MATYKCKMCGGTIELEIGATVGVCNYCGTKQTLPRLDDDRRANLYDRANHFRRNDEFDKAAGIYERILNEDPTDAEAYWSLVLCRYGIEYVEDPATHKRIPTVNRAQYTSIFDDDNYQSALQYADTLQRALYEQEASAINEIQKSILAISQKEEPFDVFICYKETDASGRRTPDSVLANDLYHQLTREGFKAFFSRITLEDKLGQEYEPYIFAALNSAKVMVVLGTKPEYFNAAWVKNEWSRYLTIVKQSGGKKILIPAFRDMDPYDLPEEFSHLQAQDMSKLGFMQDLIHGIKKIVGEDAPKPEPKKTPEVVPVSANAAPLLRRAFIFLEDGDWNKADEFCEQALNLEPENAHAYLGKLMAELHVYKPDELRDCKQPFDSSNNYRKAIRFGDAALAESLQANIAYINERNETARLTALYNAAMDAKYNADTEARYKAAAEMFESISGFKDADALCKECAEKAEDCRKDLIYRTAKAQMTDKTIASYESAIQKLLSVPGWKDADEQTEVCKTKIDEIKAKEEADRKMTELNAETERAERERKAELARIAAKKRKKVIKRIAIFLIPTIAIISVLAILTVKVFLPLSKYNAAVKLQEQGQYKEAIVAFEELDGFKGSKEQIELCENEIKEEKYNAALQLLKDGEYEGAVAAFNSLSGFKDCQKQIEFCRDQIKADQYASALKMYDEGEYYKAHTIFATLNGYKDSAERLKSCNARIKEQQYLDAVKLFDRRKYEEAIDAFYNLGRYKDSANKIVEAKKRLLSNAKEGSKIIFGNYYHEYNSSEKQGIEWIVLDKKKNSILVLSKYAVDCKLFDESGATTSTWEACSLRKWLNETFFNDAFSADEQNLIIETLVTADQCSWAILSQGNDTKDKVFLLSVQEADKYFPTIEERKCEGTSFALAQSNSGTPDRWWLRTSGKSYYRSASCVGSDGLYESKSADLVWSGVRPAIWISLG